MRKKKRKIAFYIVLIELIIISFLVYTLINKYNLHKIEEEKSIVKDEIKEEKEEIKTKKEDKKEENIVNNKEYLDQVSYNNLNIDSEVHKLIVNYMNLYYQSIEELKYHDMKQLFSDEKEAYKNETAITYLIEARKLRSFDMKLSNVKYDLNYKTYSVNNDIYKVELTENGYYNFNFMKDIRSKVYGIQNTFEIVKVNGEYKIKSYDKVQDFYVMIKNTFKDDDDYKKELDNIKSNFLSKVKEEQSKLKTEYSDKNNYKITKEYDHEYNRDEAVSYVKKYVKERNSEWAKYDDVGGNCQNYASQMLIAGGIPMDYDGDITVQWKHYSSTVNESQTKKGRSYSWTGVGYFYTYAKNNKGFGLVAQVDANYYSALKGDVVQVGYNNEYRHTAVVVDLAKDENGNIVDLIINSNTINMENFPLQGYVYPMKRVIKILGYND